MVAKETKCKIKDCKRPYRAKGYCNIHYKKWRTGELGKARYKTCGNEGCRKPLSKFGMCAEHFEAWMKSKKSAVVVAEVAPAAPAAAPAAEAPPAEAPAS
jgi:hypothetical protein